MRKHGLTPARAQKIRDRQGNRCLICGRPPKTRALHIDHDHRSGKIRGALCFTCNTMLVHALDRFPKRVPRAILYLQGRLRKPPKGIL